MTFRTGLAGILALSTVLTACGERKEADVYGAEPAAPIIEDGVEKDAVFAEPKTQAADQFSYANYNDVRVTHADLDLNVNFADKVIDGVVVLDLEYLNDDAETLILDANDLTIKSVESRAEGDWLETEYSLGPDDPVKGSRLEVALPDGTSQVKIAYRTSPEAEGLQWLSPEQTAGKGHPFLLSQFQPHLARTMAPLQDTPAVRMTYTAKVTTPPDLIAVMSAAQDPDGVRDGEYFFEMPQPIPSYLIAIAVGDIGFKAINDHIGVYAENYILDQAAKEFEDTPKMEQAISALYGPYRWTRYDMIVLPPSFPFGGMENPRLTFLTPTVVAGDKSLTNVVAHELAHSWSGNLVTNATWPDAWLNEGFTTYVENRVMEALYGEDRAVMERALELDGLKRTIAAAERPDMTALKKPGDMKHPFDGFDDTIYAGGLFFLKFLEERFGREAFDEFLRGYFNEFAFQSITTEDFLAYFEDNLWSHNPQAVTKEEIDAWVYQPGIPDTVSVPVSDAFEKVAAQRTAWLNGDVATADIKADQWTTHEWLHFINGLPEDMTTEQFAALDGTFDLSHSGNAEIDFAWYKKTISGGYEPAFKPLEAFLLRVGRGKFIYRLYEGLIENGRREWGEDVYRRARPGYHPIAQRRIDEIFAE